MARKKTDFSDIISKFCTPIPEEEIEFPPKENENIEIHYGATPSGGDLSIAYFYDKEGAPCPREKAARMNIVEYTKDGERLNEFYGSMD